MLRTIKRTITILLIISLIYANVNPAVFGLVSYALDNSQNKENTEEIAENKKELEITISEFCKNNMLEQETEYTEKLALNLNYEEMFNEIKILDIKSIINDGIEDEEIEEEEKQEINTFYKTTKINKAELLEAIGEEGKLVINYKEQETESEIVEENVDANSEIEQEASEPEENAVSSEPKNEENSDMIVLPTQESEEEKNTIVLPQEESEETTIIPEAEDVEDEEKGIIIAENGVVEINKETEADEEGYVTIKYPENTVSVEIEIVTETNQIEELVILNSKIIKQVANLDEINALETAKQIIVNGENELLNTEETSSTPIYYTKTVAELGVDKTQISSSVENKVNFTITMATDKLIYDLYKNPYFVIELPNEVKTINIDNTIVLNNQYFEIESIEQGFLENGNPAVAIKLKGEQTEYTNSMEENTQIVLETTITTNELIPTLERVINLYYQNENVKTYDGIGNQGNGVSTVPFNLVSNSEIIVETRAIIGENTVISLKDDFNTTTIEPNTYQSAKIIGTAINNTGKNIQNAKIMGQATSIGQILGVEEVYYTENENASADLEDASNGWSSEYTQNAKKFLIVIKEFSQGQTITFSYDMNLPQNIEEDIIHEAKFEVYNNEAVKTSKITIEQEAPRFDIFEDDKIQANIIFEDAENIEVGNFIKAKINIANISGQDLENVELNISLPEILKDVNSKATVNGETVSAYIFRQENEIEVIKLNIEKDTTITLEISAVIGKYVKPSETIKASINYLERQAEISNKIKIVEPSKIETTITSNKLGQTLDANEEIQYIVNLKNSGLSQANIEMETVKLESMYVQKIQTINKATGATNTIAGVDLAGTSTMLNLAPGEEMEIIIDCVSKELKKDATATMYVEFSGEDIYPATTNKLSNQVNKKVEEQTVIDDETVDVEADTNNVIQGTAWIDKNQDGQKESNETTLKGVQAVLINTETSEEVAKDITDNQGKYKFNNVARGNYIVEFKYNTNTLSVTEYKNEAVSDELDSDVINTTQANKTIAKTEMITIANGKTENVNAGFVVNKKFDMSISKGITKVTVNNEQDTNTYDFNSNSMAKVEIDGEVFKGSLILIEYEITVTNVGEVEGYAKVISDKLPEGMEFKSELNTSWYEESDGNLYCEALADTKLLPGETATVKLVLAKEITGDKIMAPVNTVKLESTFNEYLIEDKDANNNSAEATIIISLTTGKTETYMWLAIVVIAIIGLGTLGVIKVTKSNKTSMKERSK